MSSTDHGGGKWRRSDIDCVLRYNSPFNDHVRQSHPEQWAATLRHRRGNGYARQPRAQLSAPMECCAQPRPAGDPAQSRDRHRLTRTVALGTNPSLVPGPERWSKADQCQMRDRTQAADVPGRLSAAALSLFDKPVDFDNLRLVLNFAAEQLSDAIGEISDIFLATEESLGSQFEVRAVARPFLKEVTRKLDRFSMIETRVKAIQSSSVSDSPEVSKLRFQVEELLNNGRADEALHVMSASPRGAFRRE
jgi:hypothetical protein